MPQLGAMAFTREPRPAIEQMFDRAESCEIQRSTAVSSPQMGRFAWIVVLVLSLASPATGTLMPRNWLRPRFDYQPAGNENLFEITLTVPGFAHPLRAYTRDRGYTLDKNL